MIIRNEIKYRIFLAVIGGFFSLTFASGQATKGPLHYLTGQFHGGQFQVLSSRTADFRGVSPVGVEVDLAWKFVSENAYAICRCYPSVGASLNYWDFDHHALGKGLSALFYVEPVLFSPLGTDVSLKAGLGVSYLSNPYHEVTNPLNVTYSTSFSFPLMAGLSATRAINEDWAFRFSGIYQHISNGGVNQPNLGIDFVSFGLGVQHKLDDRPLPSPVSVPPYKPGDGVRDFSMGLITGLKEPAESDEKALTASLAGEYTHQFARIHAWNAGGIIEADKSRHTSIFADQLRVSLMGGHKFLAGRFAFTQNAGIYLWSGHQLDNAWFQYYSIDFDVTPDFSIGVGLKAHEKVAEYLSTRLLYRLF